MFPNSKIHLIKSFHKILYFYCFQFLFGLLASSLCRPQNPVGDAAQSAGPSSSPIPIISQTEEINPDGSFKYR